MSAGSIAARAGYGLLFTVALPVALVGWATTLDVALPVLHAGMLGWCLASAGLLLWTWGTLVLVRRGGGLPMNAFPPARLVTSGPFALVAHPIYLGFLLACAGVALATGSAAGLWVVTPLMALGCAALVIGYERPDLDRRFGPSARLRPWLSLPEADAVTPSGREALAIWLLVLLPWLIAYESVKQLGVPPDAIDVRLASEGGWPVWSWTEPIYASAYLVVPVAAFMAPTRARLRAFAIQGLVATAIVTLVYLCLPFVAPVRPVEGQSPLDALLAFEQVSAFPPVAAWPAFHVLWAAFAADTIGARSRGWSFAAWTWAAALSVSCLTTGMHAVVDVVAAWAFFVPLRRPGRMWRWLLDVCERLANSWNARRLGPFRVINHGVYAGLAATIGVAGMGWLAGRDALPGILVIAACALVGAAVWAQVFEGSPGLLRPFGFFGAVLGAAAGAVVTGMLGQPMALLFAATATVGPWVQAIGRLRCLAQGCCHGRQAPPWNGIRVSNPHSRVVAMTPLAGLPVHATPLYSILGNVAVGALLLRIWFLHAPLGLITGLYLVLSGLVRFAEEGYRGEPQTPRWLGLPVYQPIAALVVVVGAIVMTLGGAPAPAPGSPADPVVLGAAVSAGLVYWFAMGVDFPDSRRRFARLSG